MILDPFHDDVRKLSSEERHKMGRGLCPKCGHNNFNIKSNILGKALTGISDLQNTDDFVICTKCNWETTTNVFRPGAEQAEQEEILMQQKEAEKIRTAKERQRTEQGKIHREEEYERLCILRTSADSEKEFQDLYTGFRSLSTHEEYKEKGVEAFSLESEEKYLIKKLERLKTEKESAATEEDFENLTLEFKQLADEFRDLVGRKQNKKQDSPPAQSSESLSSADEFGDLAAEEQESSQKTQTEQESQSSKEEISGSQSIEEKGEIPNSRPTEEEKEEVPDSQSTEEEKEEIPGSQSTEEEKEEVPDSQSTKEEISGSKSTEEEKEEVPDSQSTKKEKEEISDSQSTKKEKEEISGSQSTKEEKKETPDFQSTKKEIVEAFESGDLSAKIKVIGSALKSEDSELMRKAVAALMKAPEDKKWLEELTKDIPEDAHKEILEKTLEALVPQVADIISGRWEKRTDETVTYWAFNNNIFETNSTGSVVGGSYILEDEKLTLSFKDLGIMVYSAAVENDRLILTLGSEPLIFEKTKED